MQFLNFSVLFAQVYLAAVNQEAANNDESKTVLQQEEDDSLLLQFQQLSRELLECICPG